MTSHVLNIGCVARASMRSGPLRYQPARVRHPIWTPVRLQVVAERVVHVGLGMHSSLCQTVMSQRYDLVALLARDG
jgi:hypothetical protein